MKAYAGLVMNTIPITFNERKIPYTILGKTDFDESENISVMILNRGARFYLSSLFKNLNALGLKNIVYIDKAQHSFEIESLSNEFTDVKFILPFSEITIGEMINLGMAEASSKFVLVFWNDMSLGDNFLTDNLISKLEEKKTLCVSPSLFDQQNQKMDVQVVPSIVGSDFYTERFLCGKDFTKTIYPFDFAGIYNRETFIKIGGFDYTIENPYWQNLDFGFRANLFGYNFLISNFFKIKYASEFPQEDISADNSYIKFYLKNLAPVMGKKGLHLQHRLFFSYAKKSGLNPFNAFKHFSAVKEWLSINRHNFITDPHSLISKWEPVL